MEAQGDHKRRRDGGEEEEEVESPEMSSPEAKRLRDDLLFDDILDNDAGAGDQDLASVMKSLEDEIGLPSTSPAAQAVPEIVPAIDQPDLGFLFLASDDELGLPPPAPASSDEVGERPEAAAASVEVEGLGQMWGFEDEINGYVGLGEFAVRPEAVVETEDGLVFDGGLFDFADAALCGPSDFPDMSWRSETLPAI